MEETRTASHNARFQDISTSELAVLTSSSVIAVNDPRK
uniref:Uncharacterized protein n=1 Tax=Parascaris equorum TaxID=6256 RepID=A0A914S4H7_PAREQ